MNKLLWLYPLGFVVGGLAVILPLGWDFIPIVLGALLVTKILKAEGEL